jgi:A/G-specific adenine glycosylase
VIHHVLTHFDWHLQPLRCELPPRTAATTREAVASGLGGRWVSESDALRMSLPAPVRQLLSDPA